MRPRISVIIPVYNGEAFLAEAIESVLAQPYPNLEILVIDDGSTDRSFELAKSFSGLRCLQQSNSGVAVARNAGIAAAGGSIYAFLDADDAWPGDHLEALLPFLEDYDMAFGQLQRTGPALRRADGSLDSLGQPFGGFAFGSALVRSEAFHRVGWFNPSYRRGEDIEWCTRAKEKGLRIHLSDRVVLYYRQHPNNLSHDSRQREQLTLRIIKESLNRRNRGEAPASLRPVELAPSIQKRLS
ncbi:MAG TPA: glycosyltransferase family A protein [bacterium]|nr:glycosyltransferase family A protein [bacterium]